VRCYLQLPPEPFRAVVRRVLAADPGFVEERRGAIQRLATLEGEHGAWVELEGTLAGAPARRVVAAILLDASVVAIDALSLDPALDADVAACARQVFDTASFGLGVRRRRYLYRRPPGWQALANGLTTTFYPPDYPRHRAQLVVYPAEPSASPPDAVFDALLEDEVRRGFERSTPVTDTGFAWNLFTGCHYAYAGQWASDPAEVCRDAVILSDRRHYYVIRLETAVPERLDEDRLLLRDLALSVEPLPQAAEGGRRVDVVQVTELGGVWAE
jgi:hypothetical protein